MSKPTAPFTTFYTASTNEAVEKTWALKRITETYTMRQEALMKEFRKQSDAITTEMQADYSALLEALRAEMNIPSEDWGDGNDWAVITEDLASGTVVLVHDTDPSRNKDDCDCPVCTLRRSLEAATDGSKDENEKPAVH
ncbi:MAG: hypothetical protein GOVbin4933_67 [Prokaryotic dsDNA virus sp.]|nr:MAG: hypothetical protein GOVbin4933_67 [Prokaryotic dsDNA virus sp.]|tara:strand:+ start:13062 stop:13478 length:417 start_codon:yes stop_codon:yes gene_type:complete